MGKFVLYVGNPPIQKPVCTRSVQYSWLTNNEQRNCLSQGKLRLAPGNLENLGTNNVPSVRLSFTFAARNAIVATLLVLQSNLVVEVGWRLGGRSLEVCLELPNG